MSANKAQLFVPQLQEGIELDALSLSQQEKSLLSGVDGKASLAEIHQAQGLTLKEALICAKTLTQKGVLTLKRRTDTQAPATRPPQTPPPLVGTVEVKSKKKQINDLAVFEKTNKRRQAEIQTGAPKTHQPQLPEKRRSKGVPSYLMRSRHPSALSNEIDKLLADEPQSEQAPSTPAPSHGKTHSRPPAAKTPSRPPQTKSPPTKAPATKAPATKTPSRPPAAQSRAQAKPPVEERQAAIALDSPEFNLPPDTDATIMLEQMAPTPSAVIHAPPPGESSSIAQTPSPPGAGDSLEAELPMDDLLTEEPSELSLAELSLEAELPLEYDEPQLRKLEAPVHTPPALEPLDPSMLDDWVDELEVQDANVTMDEVRTVGSQQPTFEQDSGRNATMDEVQTVHTHFDANVTMDEVRTVGSGARQDPGRTDSVPQIHSHSAQDPGRTDSVPQIKPKRDAGRTESVPTVHSRSSSGSLEAMLESKDFQASLERDRQKPASGPNGQASEILAGFGRVLSCFKLYDPRNRAVKDALAELYQSIAQFLQEHGELVLSVQPFAILRGADTVYANADRETSLAFMLYRDGIRGLTFQPGFDAPQLARFLQLLALSQSSATQNEDDLVTLFWKSELPHTQLLSVSGFKLTRQEDAPTPMEALFRHMLKPQQEDDEPLPFSRGIGEETSLGSSLVAYFLQEENPKQVLEQLSILPLQYSPQPPELCEALQKELEPGHAPQEFRRFLEFLQKHPALYQDFKYQKGLTQWLETYGDALLHQGDFDGLHALHGWARRWAQDDANLLFMAFGQSLQGMFHQPDKLHKLLAGLQLGPEDPLPQALLELFARSHAEVIPVLFQLLRESRGPCHTARKLLVHLHHNTAQPFVAHLKDEDPGFVIQMLECLKLVGGSAATASIAEQVEHSSPKVREAVLDMAEVLFSGQHKVGQLRGVVMNLLSSQDPLERNRAYGIMERSNDSRWATSLLKMFEERQDIDVDELEELGALAGKLNPDASIPVMLKLAHPPGKLRIERSWRKNQRDAAIKVLTAIGNLKAEEGLRKLIKLSSGQLKQSYIDAMKALRRGTPSVMGLPAQASLSSAPAASSPRASSRASDSYDGIPEVEALQSQMASHLDRLDLQGENNDSAQLRDDGAKLVTLFHVLVKTAHLYEPNNQIFDRPVAELIEIQERLLLSLPHISMVGLEDQFYINDLRIRMQGGNIQQICHELCQDFERRKIGGLNFREPLDDAQWRLLGQLYAGKVEIEQSADWLQLHQAFQRARLGNAVEVLSEITFRVGEEKQLKSTLIHLYAQGLGVVEEAWLSALYAHAPNTLPIRRLANDFVDYFQRHPNSLMEGLAFEDPIHPLKTHMLNVMMLSIRIGKQLGLTRLQQAELGVAGFYHDIGHVGLIGERRHQVVSQNHQQAGLRGFLLQNGYQEARLRRILAILEHHDNFQAAFEDQEVSPGLFARIIQVADLYDTFTTQRLMGGPPYPPSMTLQRLNSGQGRHFDPSVVQALINVVGMYPLGSLLELGDTTLAVSMGSDGSEHSFERPVVLTIRAGGTHTKAYQQLDLTQWDTPIKRAHMPPPDVQPKQYLTHHFHKMARKS